MNNRKKLKELTLLKKELVILSEKLNSQNREEGKNAADLTVASRELVFQKAGRKKQGFRMYS